jgi:hypothetical protein
LPLPDIELQAMLLLLFAWSSLCRSFTASKVIEPPLSNVMFLPLSSLAT